MLRFFLFVGLGSLDAACLYLGKSRLESRPCSTAAPLSSCPPNLCSSLATASASAYRRRAMERRSVRFVPSEVRARPARHSLSLPLLLPAPPRWRWGLYCCSSRLPCPGAGWVIAAGGVKNPFFSFCLIGWRSRIVACAQDWFGCFRGAPLLPACWVFGGGLLGVSLPSRLGPIGRPASGAMGASLLSRRNFVGIPCARSFTCPRSHFLWPGRAAIPMIMNHLRADCACDFWFLIGLPIARSELR